ncbi:alpha/beta fold hydrolase [Roseomonas chloroacetimidivorans]|uniref:alpha/beta fold hydrolase n=1 Tax=Roseomonas chloroacetimidivorans TaxID=1766656 RepID=UPI003C75EF5B
MFERVGDLLVHYVEEGPADAPVLLMLHSLGTSLHVWDPQASALSRSFRVLRPDMRGHGLTEVTAGPYDIPSLAHDVLGLLKQLGIRRAHVAGISIGGRIALEMAALAPDAVETLILCDTALTFPPADLWQHRADVVRASGIEAIADAVMARWVVDAAQPSALGLRQMLLRTPPEGYAGAAEALRDVTPDSVRGRINCPTTIIVGEKDLSTPPEAAQTIHSAIPGSAMTVIPAGAHIPTFECAAGVTKAIRSALTQHMAKVA